MNVNHSFNVGHAQAYGMREAVLIQNLHFWVSHNYANKTHEHDGKTWTYNSVKAFESLFPYLTYKQIRTSLETLVALDVLVRGYYGANPADRSSWYAFTDAFLVENPLPENPHPARNKRAPSAPQGKCPSAPQGTPSALQGKSLIDTDVNTDTPGFASFYSVYPKKTAKPTALKAYKAAKIKPAELDCILVDIETRKNSDDWEKENGKYIPNPATYLNQRRWEDGETAHTGKQKINGVLAGAI
jgi:hypothetical protein